MMFQFVSQDIYLFVWRSQKRVELASLPVCWNFALVAERLGALAMATGAPTFWRDDEIVVDKDGTPHYTGKYPHLMKEYRRRVLFAYNMLDGEGGTEEKERKDLARKQARFAKRLLDCLHGEAWRTCQGLMDDMEALKAHDAYKLIFRCLQSIERVTIVKKTEQFDKFFEKGFRRRGQPLDEYLRTRKQDWADLKDLDESTNMSDDLLAYFVLKQCGLSKEDRRQILLSNQSKYDLDGIMQTMRVSFFDIHEKERAKPTWEAKGHGRARRSYLAEEVEDPPEEDFPEDQEEANGWEEGTYMIEEPMDHMEENPEQGVSDAGASGDDEVYEAYAAMDAHRKSYKDSRKKLKDIQKARGFFKSGENHGSDRQRAVEAEKARTRCSACNRVGHWAGDKECPVAGRSGPKRFTKGKSKGHGKKSGGKSYLAMEQPMLFTLGEEDMELDGFCNMVKDADEMQQDDGLSELDFKRKKAGRPTSPAASSEGWSKVSEVSGYGSGAEVVPPPWSQVSVGPLPEGLRLPSKTEEKQMPVRVEEDVQVKILTVHSIEKMKPELSKMTVRDLQTECDRWGIKVSGSKSELFTRLTSFFDGNPVCRKGCTKKFVMIEEEKSPNEASKNADVPRSSHETKHAFMVSEEVRDNEAEVVITPKSRPIVNPYDGAFTDSRFFRSSERESRATAVIRDLERRGDLQASPALSTQTWPQSGSQSREFGSELPPLKLGETLPGIRCGVCNATMVVRQNRTRFNLFMGCSQFGRTGCR